MKEYHKIQTVYLRDPDNNFKTLLDGQFSKPEFRVLKDIEWDCTEKIDGTNIRVMWRRGDKVRFGGKKDNSNIHTYLRIHLENTFTEEKMEQVFPEEYHDVCLYGEGYGLKIQDGHNYLKNSTEFILFDVKIGDWWLSRQNVVDVADKLGIWEVPSIGIMTLEEAISEVSRGFTSNISDNVDYIAEGLIMKPLVDLFNRSGERVITKIKYKDFLR